MVSLAQLGPAIDVRPQFAAERAALLELLTDLRGEEWDAPTVCPGWPVRDVVAHLLHDDLRRLSRTRDRYSGGAPPAPRANLVAFLNAANQRWVTETRFLSPVLLIDLLAHTSRTIEEMWAAAELDAPSEGVWWAGIDLAPVWLDLARDFSEDWTHQQQVRDATGRPGLTEARFLDPVLDTFLRALPHTYRQVPAPPGVTVLVAVEDSERQLTWALQADSQGWTLHRDSLPQPIARVSVPAGTLWRLATGGISPDAARETIRTEGDRDLAEPLLHIVSVVR